MRELYRNPIFYYLLIPVLVALWPLLVWGVYLPRAERDQENEQALYVEAQTCIVDILKLDPDRINIAIDVNQVAEEFSYGSAVDRVANLCKIPASSWTSSAGNIIKSQNKKRQDAMVKLTNVSIAQAAKFLWTMQVTWATLSCEKVKLTKKKGLPDQWDVDFTFTYYY
jgi:hypothetical protein